MCATTGRRPSESTKGTSCLMSRRSPFAGSDVSPPWVSRCSPFQRLERGEDAAVGNAAFSWTAVLDAAQLRRKPTQIGDSGFDIVQVVFRDAINARTSHA